ncbi:MAG: helix-turn-helix transcriptional regulator [Myxococcales bacterium]|nr:helix-turn-helix transcriptional regulator [Myxococcales bacterium]
MAENIDFDAAAQELLKALRGRRSQRALSRRMGFRTNVVYTWEAGRTYPGASRLLVLAELIGLDARACLARFYRVPPPWLAEAEDVTTPEAVAALLRHLAGDRPTVELARATGKSRFAVARILSGESEPRVPDLLRIVQALTARALDFVAAFVDPADLPSLAQAWQRLETSRRLAYEEPMAHAVLRVLELSAYHALPAHRDGFVAEHLGITPEAEARYLSLLQDSGQIEWQQGRLVPMEDSPVDTRRDRARAAALRAFWTRVALERIGQRDDDAYGYSLGTVSERDLERIRELHRRYFTELRSIVSGSHPAEVVLLANAQLVRLA